LLQFLAFSVWGTARCDFLVGSGVTASVSASLKEEDGFLVEPLISRAAARLEAF
jgi:hypothetical protein